MILARNPAQQKVFDHHAKCTDQKWREEKRDPVIDTQRIKKDDRGHGAQHVHRAMGKIYDLEQAENNRQPEAQERIKRAINDPDQQLASQHSKGDAKNHGHVAHSKSSANVIPGSIVASSRGDPSRREGAPRITIFFLCVICWSPAGTCSRKADGKPLPPGWCGRCRTGPTRPWTRPGS